MQSDAQVLGISSPPPVAGTPVLAPEALVIYIATFVVGVIVLYLIFHFIKKPLLLAHKVKLVLFIALSLKILMATTALSIAALLLVPTPGVLRTTPSNEEQKIGKSPKIEIRFDRPIDRGALQKSIIPEVPGVWTFEDPVYSTHLYRKVVFNPTVSLEPDTTYLVTLSGISNFVKVLKPAVYTFTFTTNPSPKVLSVTPEANDLGVEITDPITVQLTNPNDGMSQFEFSLSPETELDVKLSEGNSKYILTPKSPLQQGVNYILAVKRTNLRYNLPSNKIIERSTTTTEFEGGFTTKEAPGIVKFTPTGGEIIPKDQIKVTFTQPMNKQSVEKNFETIPQISGKFEWTDDSNMTFIPANMDYETTYKVKIPKNTLSLGGGFIPSDIEKTFTTIGKVVAEKIYPENGWMAIGVNNQLKVTFDQEVDKQSAENKFRIDPLVDGVFAWARNTLIFTPTKPLSYGTKYTISIDQGVKSVKGLDSAIAFLSQFTTQDQTYKLDVPSFLQKYSLSCEIAALRMALGFKGISLSEDEIIQKIGFDSTPRNGGIWGNPHASFVGDINGRQMVTGYGVYWEPIARVAKGYRNALDFRNWDITQLTKMLNDKHPVIIWTYSSNGSPTSWLTSSGQNIKAVRGEHAVVAVGYVGDINNPTAIIVNDPLYGQVQWPRQFFDKKWGAFEKSGVVVF